MRGRCYLALNVVRIHEKPGFRFAEVQGTPADHASWWSFDDEQEVRDRHWHPKAGEVVLDIGAAFGSYVLPALAAGARVVAFSPADFDTELLEKNLSLNPELGKRCIIVRDGIYSQNGAFDPDRCVFVSDAEMESSAPELYGTIGNRADGGAGFPKGQLIRTRSLDSFMRSRPGIERIDWIKIDIEGAEFEALKGAEQCLRRWHPKLLIEFHLFHDAQIDRKCIELLSSLGYSCDGPHQHCAVSHAFFEVR